MYSVRTLAIAFVASLARKTLAESAATTSPTSQDCSCGYQDPATHKLYTESTIVYFNETSGVLQEFSTEVFTNKYEKNWNAIYRQGADAENVLLNTSSTDLEMTVSPPTGDHVVIGGGIRSLRSDIQFGSFRSLLQPSGPYAGGSAMSMFLKYNLSQAIEMNVMNTDKPDTAWTSTLIGEEFPNRTLGINFTALQQDSIAPWDLTEYRIDWSAKEISWYIGGTLVRNATSRNVTIPSVPMPIFLNHWSTGNRYAEQGPPSQAANAHVGYARLFFNSSLMTTGDHQAYDSRCLSAPTCSTEDLTLRGSTAYAPEALQRWKQVNKKTAIQWIAIWMSVVCITCTTLLLMHTLIPRMINRIKASRQGKTNSVHTSTDGDETKLVTGGSSVHGGSYADSASLNNNATMSITSSSTGWGAPLSESTKNLRTTSQRLSLWQQGGSARSVVSLAKVSANSSIPATPPALSRLGTANGSPTPGTQMNSRATTMINLPVDQIMIEENIGKADTKKQGLSVSVVEVAPTTVAVTPKQEPLKPRARVDYLAGLTAVCAIIVSVEHFCSTFVPAVIFPGAAYHHIGEVWTNKIITPYFINQIWIGVFFTCSTRFLVTRYLKAGDLSWIANKAVTRNFRVMIPIIAVAMLEYFLMECGATTWLEYLPSITWSTWPFTTPYNSFGDFVSEILEIVYIVPPAFPQIIFNYCTGVLWTMPVQLQGSWTVLLGVVVIHEIKNPLKRFSYYAIAIIFNWYALSWGTYFWFGLLMADLDIVFKYRKQVTSRPLIFYPLTITLGLIVIASLSVDTINQWLSYSFIDAEHSIHPDPYTGLPIYKANPLEPSEYYIPRLNGITFSVALQPLIELSPTFQSIFGCKPLTWIFPHIFTIYLFHGLIFWSLGSMICVFLSSHGIPYSLNIFIVALCCYAALILSLPIVTPVVELLGKHWTASIWQSASDAPPPKRDTLFPYTKSLLGEGPHEDCDNSSEKFVSSTLHSKTTSTSSITKNFLDNKNEQGITEKITEIPMSDSPAPSYSSHKRPTYTGAPSTNPSISAPLRDPFAEPVELQYPSTAYHPKSNSSMHSSTSSR